MVDWQSPEVVERTMSALIDILYFLLGVYMYVGSSGLLLLS